MMAALLEAARSHGVVLGFHHDDPISALFLGAVQSFIGQLNQAFKGAVGGGQNKRRADAQRVAALDASWGIFSSAIERCIRVSTSATYSRLASYKTIANSSPP